MTQFLQAGVARADITPPIGVAHAGWGAQLHERAVGVDLPLSATALALSDGNQIVVIVDIEATYLMEPEAAEARKTVAALTGLPESHIRLSYTHTHSGPIHRLSGTWIEGGTEMIPSYKESLQHKIAGAAWSAICALQPVRVSAGRGACAIGVNRRFQRPEDDAVIVGRNWEGPVDHEVQVIRFDTTDGQPLATIVDYACHPITVGPDNDLLTPDYPGVVKRVVEEATGSTCLFLQGAAGDIGPVRGVARNGIHEYRRLGAALGHEVSRIWWEMELPQRTERYVGTLESGAPLAIYDDMLVPDVPRQLQVLFQRVELPAKVIGDPEELEAAAQAHADRLAVLRSTDGNSEEILQETMLSKRALMRALLAKRLDGKTGWPVELQGIALGPDIALWALSAEPFVEIGRQIKDDSPFASTIVSGYSNVGWGYLPTADAYPFGGYEIEVSPFAPEAAEEAVSISLSLLHEMASVYAERGVVG